MAMRFKMKDLNRTKTPDYGAVIPHVAVTILQRKRKRHSSEMYVDGGSQVKPMVQDNPFPHEYEH